MKKLLFLLATILFTNCRKEPEVSPATPSTTIVVNERTALNSLLTPLKKQPLDLEDQDLKIFDNLKNVPIIGLGEATHGTKEFFEMKHRLFKYFVENFNHRIFAFEMDYGESLIFDEYVQTGKGDLVQLMKDKMYFWTWNTVEVKNLLEWMKNYNQTKSPSERVHIYGIDCQTFKYNVPELLKRINLVTPSLNNNLTNLIGKLSTVSSGYKGEFHDNVVEAKQLILKNKNLIISKSSLQEYSIIEHLADIILQTDVSETDFASNSYSSLRDEYMADNVVWLSEQSAFPLSIWAHNRHVHVANEKNYMGTALSQKYQEKYQTVGFSFANGTVTARNLTDGKLMYNKFPESVSTDYINQLFSQASSPNFVVKMKDVFSNDLLNAYFSKRPFYQIGSGFSDQFKASNFTTLKAYNFTYLVHINTSTHSDCYRIQ